MTSRQQRTERKFECDLVVRSRRAEPDSPSNSVTYVLLTAIARLEETDVTDLPPLADAIDPSALERVVESLAENSTASSCECTTSDPWEITFRYAGYDLLVDSRPRLVIRADVEPSGTKRESE